MCIQEYMRHIFACLPAQIKTILIKSNNRDLIKSKILQIFKKPYYMLNI